jgi:hypothetical protein
VLILASTAMEATNLALFLYVGDWVALLLTRDTSWPYIVYTLNSNILICSFVVESIQMLATFEG